jgi:protein-disulfide isomerase
MAFIRTLNIPLVVAALVVCAVPTGAQSLSEGAAVAARIGNRTVTYDDLDRAALVQSSARFRGLRLRDAIYEARRAALDALVADDLIAREAARLHVLPAALVEREVAERVAPVSEAEVEAWFKANQGRLNGASLDTVAARIRQALEDTNRSEARARFVDQLRTRTTVEVRLVPPRETLVVQPAEPAAGPEHAPVQIVMYSDYQCPYCARVEPTLEKVKAVYGDRVRVVFRDFPLSTIHPRAVDAARAAHCAHDQDRFWEYHDRLFSKQSRMESSDFLQHAADLGLDPARFTTCIASERVAALVRDNAMSGERLGVSSTPAFFVNGRFMTGAQPFDVFKRVIDDELGVDRASK